RRREFAGAEAIGAATRIEPVPAVLRKPHRAQAMQAEAARIVAAGKPLVAQAGRNPVGAQQRRQEMGLREAAAHARAENLGGADRERGSRGWIAHRIPDELEAALDQRALRRTGDRELASLA